MDFYSALLLLSMLVVGLAVVLHIGRLAKDWDRSHWGSWKASVVALTLSLLALVVHWSSGHRPGSAAALDPIGFIAAHRAPFVVVGVAAASMWWARRGRRHQDA